MSENTNVISLLNKYLSDLQVLTVKTKKYHWNMEGKRFYPFHKLLQEQYEAIDEAIDEVAERIPMVHGKAFGTLKEYLDNTSLKESPGVNPSEEEMVKDLLSDHEAIINLLKEHIKSCQDAGDEGSADLLIKQIQFHEKAAWMLRASS